MVDELNKTECTGCGACVNICPVQAIAMKEDKSGFSYPYISENCIKCHKCDSVCKSRLTRKNENMGQPITYAAWSKDESIRYESTSGGAFSEFAKEIINSNGIVVGAQYNSGNSVEHIIIKSIDDLKKIRQSKYVQSDIGSVFSDIKDYLNKNKTVLFCGCPCQVAGLYSFLEKKYENLITIDFICRGVNSPKAYKYWLKEIEDLEKSKVVNVWFKYKENGWKKSPRCTKIEFESGINKVYNQKENLFMEGYLTYDLYMRPSCGVCHFKGVPRQADITLADFWKISEALDDDKGTSMVLLNNKTGIQLMEKVKSNLYAYEQSFDEICAGNTYFNKSAKISKKSERFLSALDEMPFSAALKKFSYESLVYKTMKRIVWKSKQVFRCKR